MRLRRSGRRESSPTSKPAPQRSGPDPRDAAPTHLALTSGWSIRSKIVAVLVVPLLTVLVMWILATWVTLAPGVALLNAQESVDAVGRPTQDLVAALQAERKASIGYLAAEAGDAAALGDQRETTDATVAVFRAQAASGDARSALTPEGSDRLTELLLHLDALPGLRGGVDDRSLDRPDVLRRYSLVVEAGLHLNRSLIQPSNEDLRREARALDTLSEARELLAREDAVVTGAFEAGTFTAADLSQAVQLIGAQRHQFALARPDLHATDRTAYDAIAGRGGVATLAALEDRLIAQARAGEPVPLDPQTWREAYDQVTDDLRVLELDAADRLVERSRPEALFIFVRIGITGLLGLVALVVTALGSLRVARSLLRRLAGLRQAALELAIDRLPRVVARLRQGERVDVAAEAPPLPYGADEIGQVGHAFNELQRTAVASAVAEADLRRGVNEVFLNIARRSQTLLHRQLSILDNMERRTEDPVELEDLFRVDHLATRMRRHAEDLVILAGAAPGRGWRQPVPLVDVVRGAVSEVEDYARVTVRPLPDLAVTGRAVGDLIHLLAELIENATSFSPPTTKVTVSAEPVTHGAAVEIEDRGIGIPSAELDQVNARLADPPDFTQLAERVSTHGDSGGGQLGLFVVARLAARHGIQVQLRRSAYGGTTAVVLLPDALLAVPGQQAALPPGSAGSGEPSTGGLLPLQSASPNAPRSAGGPTAVGLTPTPSPGGALPRRPGGARLEEAETAIIVATPGKPLGRHAREEVIDPVDDPDGLPRRVRQRDPDPTDQVDIGRTGRAASEENATQPDDARSPEQVRAMMSTLQAGLERGRQAADEEDGQPPVAGRTADTAVAADGAGAGAAGGGEPVVAGPDGAGLDAADQSGSQAPGDGARRSRRRRADGGG